MSTSTPTKSPVYDVLLDHYIRLLRASAVEPRNVCSLGLYPLDRAPAFHGVSYAWGHNAVDHTAILCDSHELFVTPHLHEGLHCLTSSYKVELLWVDAVCINQERNEEKARQIRHMHPFFKSAIEVFGWLGAANDTSELALNAVSDMRDVLKILPDHADDYRDTFARCGHLMPHGSIWRASTKLYGKLWMQRLWVIQEMVLARKSVVLCILIAMEWDTITDFAVDFEKFMVLDKGPFPLDRPL